MADTGLTANAHEARQPVVLKYPERGCADY